MAKFDFNTYEQSKNTGSQTYQKSNVGYFNSLKDDGDEAVVRFAYSSPAEFDLVTVHNVQVGDKWRKVSCLRNANDPIDTCPLCAKGEKVLYKFYVKLVEYTTNEMGQVVATPKIWERPVSFAKTLKSYFDEYGNLSDCVFKVKRHGIKGSLQTTYDIMFANPMIYKPEIYVKNFDDFKNFDLVHHSYMNKSFEDLTQFVQTGEFPVTSAKYTVAVDTSIEDGQEVAYTTQPMFTQQSTSGGYVAPTSTVASQEPSAERPRRVYQY